MDNSTTSMIDRSKLNDIIEVEPDAWDLKMIADSEKENDEVAISIEELARQIGVAL